MDDPQREVTVRRMLAWLGAVTAVVGLLGLLLFPAAYAGWVFLMAFGVATAPRWLMAQIRKRRHPPSHNDQSH